MDLKDLALTTMDISFLLTIHMLFLLCTKRVKANVTSESYDDIYLDGKKV